MKKVSFIKIFTTILSIIPAISFSQTADSKDYFPLEQSFVFILVTASLAVFVGIIYVLTKNFAWLFEKMKEKAKSNSAKAILMVISLGILLPSISSAQNNSTATTSWYSANHLAMLILAAVSITLLLIVILISKHFLRIMKLIYGKEETKPQEEEVKVSLLDRVLDSFNASVPLAKEKDVMLDHDYDGIKELDNSLPPWWLYGFYATIIFAFVYIIYYHLGGPGLSSTELYAQEIQSAKEEQAVKALADSKNNVSSIDENNVIRLTDAASLSDAQKIFSGVCASCHGMQAQGGAGPNLTDKFWIHGGSINEIYHTIKTGVSDKGMPQWSTVYKPADIQKLASYVMSLQGTNPAGQKEPQGTLFEPVVSNTDSATVTGDTSAKK